MNEIEIQALKYGPKKASCTMKCTNIFFTQFQECKIVQYVVYGYIDR